VAELAVGDLGSNLGQERNLFFFHQFFKILIVKALTWGALFVDVSFIWCSNKSSYNS
jgi:hypothetical protein